MKKITLLIVFCFVQLFSLSYSQSFNYLQSFSGIFIRSPYPVEIYLNQQKMSPPIESFMVVNLFRGEYYVEAYRVINRKGAPLLKEKVLDEHVYYDGNSLSELVIDDRYQGRNHFDRIKRLISDERFEKLMKDLREAHFNTEFNAILNVQLDYALFTTKQVVRIVNLKDWDSERLPILKKMYPSVVDIENSPGLIKALDWSENQTQLTKFMRDYNQNHEQK